MTVVSGDYKADLNLPVENLLTFDKKESQAWDKSNYWSAPNYSPATFILNLGCPMMFNKIQLANTHAAQHKDRATREFK